MTSRMEFLYSYYALFGHQEHLSLDKAVDGPGNCLITFPGLTAITSSL